MALELEFELNGGVLINADMKSVEFKKFMAPDEGFEFTWSEIYEILEREMERRL